jgi:hypothetical protein
MSMFARMMGSAAAPAVAATGAPIVAPAAPVAPAATGNDPAAPAGLTEAQIEPMLVAAKAEGNAEGLVTGATAERERTAAVFASEGGQANMPMAAWMLESSPNASAESIIGKLATMPKGSPVASTTAPAAPAPLTTPLAQTPAADLGTPAAANDGTGQAAPSADDAWDSVMTDLTKGGTFGANMRLSPTLAVHQPAAGQRTGH